MADASALVEYLLRTDRSSSLEAFIRAPEVELHVPALCDVEVASAFRRALLMNAMSEDRAAEAVDDYLALPLTRHGHQSLLPRVLALRPNFSAYDATYVALAEQLRAEILTADEPLARAIRTRLRIRVVPALR